MPNVVFYHYPCPDGVFAALSAKLALNDARFVPMTVYSKPEDRIALASTLTKADTAYILDYTGGQPFIRAVAAAAQTVYILDHHKTAEEDCASLPSELPNLHLTIDMGRSGAGIARDHFGTAALLKEKVGEEGAAETLRLIDYVQDNDLWKHALPDSKLAALGFGESKVELDPGKNPGLWDTLLGLRVEGLVAKGREEQAKQDKIIGEELSRAKRMTIPASGTGPALTAMCIVTGYPDYRSVEGNQLAALSAAQPGLPAVGIVAYTEPGLAPGPDGEPLIKVSLRSVGDVDTTPVSKAYGGGGHKNASSFNVARKTFDTWWV